MKTKSFQLLIVTFLSLWIGIGYATAQKTSLVRVHENMRETPYPQSFHTPYLNPTPLLVPKEMRKADYLQFELSTDPSFPVGNTITSKPLLWCMFNPHQILSNGNWYWRFRSVTKDGTSMPWSETYSFTVSDEIPKFVTPTFEEFFKNMPAQSPRLYCFLNEDIQKARKTIQTHSEYPDLIRRAKIGLDFDYTTNANPFDVAGKAGLLFCHMHTAYALTGDEAYSTKMVAYVRALLKSTPNEKLLKNDFYAGDLIYVLTHTYDICYDQFSNTEREQIKQLVFKTAQGHHNIQRTGTVENHIFDNHYWQRAFREMLQIGLLFGDKDAHAKEVLEYCYELWTARAPASGFNRDGEWHNGHGYFDANLKTLFYVPSLMSYMTKTDFLQHPWYQNAGKTMAYVWPPRSMSAGFGDGNEGEMIPPKQRTAFADFIARETGDPYAAWYTTQCKNASGDFDIRLYRIARSASKNYAPQETLPADAPKALWLEDTGEMMMHSDLNGYRNNLFLSFRSSSYGSGSHTLADQNGFNLHYRGVPVYRSTGYYLNFSDRHNLLSYRHTRAHNTILIDGIGQPFSTKGYGKILQAMNGKNISYALGDASNAYSGISEYPMWERFFADSKVEQSVENGFGETPLKLYRRHIFMLHPDIVVIYDEMEATKPVRWDWLLHSPVQFQIDEQSKLLTTRYDEKKFSSLAQIFSNSDYILSQTDQFVVAPNEKLVKHNRKIPNQWHLTATFTPSSANRVLTIIQILPDGRSKKMLSRNGNHFRSGKWNIKAEMDPAKPAAISINNPDNGALFSFGDTEIEVKGKKYNYTKGASVLYDEIDGKQVLYEMPSFEPSFTGAKPE